MKNRVGRAIVGILALILLGFYTYRQEQIHWHSADVESWGPATGLHPEGFESGVVMNAQPEAPVQMDFSTPAPPEPAPAEVPAELPAPEGWKMTRRKVYRDTALSFYEEDA